MGFLTKAFSYFAPPPSPPAIQVSSSGKFDSSWADAGVNVTAESAMRVTAFWACVRLLASVIGSLPAGLYERTAAGPQSAAESEPLYRILHDSPNGDQTPTDFFEGLVISLLLAGNHYSRKIKNGIGDLISLEPISPQGVEVYRRADKSLGYRWTDEDGPHDLGEADIFHVRGFGGGPLRGLSVLSYGREALGSAIAAERTAAGMFRSGLRPSGTLEFDKPLTPEQREFADDQLISRFTGTVNAGKPMILEAGAKWNPLSLNSEDAQLLESRAFSVEEICRLFGVPPFMIGHSEKSSSWGTGIEQQTLGFQKFTINPYLRRIEQAVGKQLIAPAKRGRLFAKFNVEGLLRADTKARGEWYRTMTGIGAMTRNEVREKENLPPVEGGDVITVQSQNVPLLDAIAAMKD